jgi:hypothetical protein
MEDFGAGGRWWAGAGGGSWEFCLESIACRFGRGFSRMVADEMYEFGCKMVPPDFSRPQAGWRFEGLMGSFVEGIGNRVFQSA